MAGSCDHKTDNMATPGTNQIKMLDLPKVAIARAGFCKLKATQPANATISNAEPIACYTRRPITVINANP